MDARKQRDLPAGLAGLRRRFEDWRSTHRVRSRIPASLWGSAVKMAGAYGLHRTARTLRLDYYALKKRVETARLANGSTAMRPAARSRAGVATPFLELIPPLAAGVGECIMEWENAAGARMRVHLKGVAPPDVAALSRSFWDSRP